MEKKRNLWVIPTDKSSRLFDDGIELYLGQLKDRKGHPVTSYNIFINSDEEIKEESLTKEIYVIDIQNENIGKLTCKNNFFKGSCKLIGIEWKNKQDIWNYYHIREIILTTDVDLIKDGVQAIDDEFLEWFVKNPSCEEVSITKGSYNLSPMEEILEKEYVPKSTFDTCKIIISKEEPKQETLEEAAERLYPISKGGSMWMPSVNDCNNANKREGFIAGAKSDAAKAYWHNIFKQNLKRNDKYKC